MPHFSRTTRKTRTGIRLKKKKKIVAVAVLLLVVFVAGAGFQALTVGGIVCNRLQTGDWFSEDVVDAYARCNARLEILDARFVACQEIRLK